VMGIGDTNCPAGGAKEQNPVTVLSGHRLITQVESCQAAAGWA
jgi:hypothetical protein